MSSKQVNAVRIRDLRDERLWTQEQLCEVSGVSLRSVQRAEKGGALSMESVKNLAAAFDVDADELLLKTDAPTSKPTHVVRHLPRITSGRELGLLANCEGYLLDHEEAASEEEAHLMASFLGGLQEWGTVWGDLDAGERIRAERAMKEQLLELESARLWVFGRAYPYTLGGENGDAPMRWQLACVVVKRSDFPGIVRRDDAPGGATLPALYPRNPQLRI